LIITNQRKIQLTACFPSVFNTEKSSSCPALAKRVQIPASVRV
jgi:hypothetical protein